MKKSVLVISILFLAIFIPFASAGFFDLFKKNVQESPVDVSVSVQGAAPTIATPLPNIIDLTNPGLPNTVNPVTNSINAVEVRFIAQDSNGITDLPGGITSTEAIILATSLGEVTANTSNMEVYITSPTLGQQVIATSCVEDVTCTDCGALTNAREYICDFTTQYYFEPSSLWTVSVNIADPTDLTSGVDSSKNFEITSLKAYDISAGGLSWTSISLSSQNQIADSSLGLTNRGNIDITTGDLTGQNLTPSSTGDSLPVSAFTVSTLTGGLECNSPTNADKLIDGTPVTITAGGSINLIFGNGAGAAPILNNEIVYFCVQDQLDTLGLSLTSPSYSATTTGLNAWDLTLA